MKRISFVNQYELPVRIVKDRDGYLATCPVWKDCYAQGDTLDEALSEIATVAASLIELYRDEGLVIPLKLQRRSEEKSRLSLKLPLLVSAV